MRSRGATNTVRKKELAAKYGVTPKKTPTQPQPQPQARAETTGQRGGLPQAAAQTTAKRTIALIVSLLFIDSLYTF